MAMKDFAAAAMYQDKPEEVAWDDRFVFSPDRVYLFSKAGESEQSRAFAQKWLDARPYKLSAQIMLSIGNMCSEGYVEAIHIREKVKEPLSLLYVLTTLHAPHLPPVTLGQCRLVNRPRCMELSESATFPYSGQR